MEYYNQLLDNISGTLYDEIDADYDEVRSLVKNGLLCMHYYETIEMLLERDPVEDCIQNMNAIHDHIHVHPEFVHEYSSDVLFNEHSDSIYVQYAIVLKRYKHNLEIQRQSLYPFMIELETVSPEDVGHLIPVARDRIQAYLNEKKNVCSSIFRLFEYIVEYEQLNFMRPPSLPSYVPLPEEEVIVPRLLQPESLEPSIPSPDPHPTLLLSEEEAPVQSELQVLQGPLPEDDIPPIQDEASVLPQSEPLEE